MSFPKKNTFDVEEILKQLTLQEKVELLSAVDFWHTSKIPRLGIDWQIRVSDGPNGIRGTRFFDSVPSACFPNGTGLASSFNSDLLEKAGKLMAVEARHKNAHIILGPTTNIQRGPLGGRGFESFSEDPYLSGIATASIVKGIQADGDIGATVKHFVCNDLEHERFSSNSIVSQRALREIYLEPFRLAIKLANPACIMTAYNKVNGTHCSENESLISNILRKEWAWNGLVMSDWFGTYSTVESLKNGLDIEFPGPSKFRQWPIVKHLLQSKEGDLSEEDHINERCRHVLSLMKFVKQNNLDVHGYSTTEDALNNTKETSSLLRELGAETIVLLKNNNNILPLSAEKDSIAVIGPNATAFNTYSGGGSASLNPYYVVTPLQGIQSKLGGSKKVAYTIGCHAHKALSGLLEVLTNDLDPSKNGSKASFYLKSAQDRKVAKEVPIDTKIVNKSFVTLFDYDNQKINPKTKEFYIDFEGYLTPKETGDYQFGVQVFGTALLYIDDKLVIDNKTTQTKGTFCFSSGTIEETAIVYLEAGKKYKITVEYGSGFTSKIATDFGGGGLQVGFTKVIDAQEEIAKAVELAKSHDKVVLCIGLNSEWESEGYDRTDMSLPRKTDDLVSAVLKANPNTVVINQSGTPVEMPWIADCNAFIQAWYGGNELGNSIADVLFGDVVPSGKLSLSWPKKNEDNPAYLNFHTEMGRVLYGEDIFVGYRYYDKLQRTVLFPFGYGLSYTTFEFEHLEVSPLFDEGKLNVACTVSNTGDYAGKEVVQLYVGAATCGNVTKPVKELKGFKKVFIEKGSSVKVGFELSIRHITSYFDEFKGRWCSESGDYRVFVGRSSDELPLFGKFTVKETTYWTGL
ncbi:probable Beta-glucosidase [Saccharomycodes ludwigii]|uniref:beta-glucosidase n=1 Tax=Saccharomycodes ludwigii TaxID=36035 RepID=A0A376BAU8_9ASCO|nr:conserved putative beta-glucosidase [Saccharomycodes ludwigii]KAH3901646.1 conserved putative beta-glucosidase [Saccharomycodes ludwigii]SSD61776.1 probable Beta-glucosidase [Saccharomycodes ludwigii]